MAISSFLKRRVYRNLLIAYYSICNIFFAKTGVAENLHNPELIVNLTSYPLRFKNLHLTLETLLQQSLKPSKIILWLSEEEVQKSSIPKKVSKLVSRGLRIEYGKGNLRSYKKLIHAIRENPDAINITVDDDILYPPDFLENLYVKFLKNKKCIVAYRCTYIKKVTDKDLVPYVDWESPKTNSPSYNLFPTGAGGILYPPKSLHSEVLNEKEFLRICPTADDVWFKAMGLLNKTKTVMVYYKSKEFLPVTLGVEDSLYEINVLGNKNDEQIRSVFSKYDLYKYLK